MTRREFGAALSTVGAGILGSYRTTAQLRHPANSGPRSTRILSGEGASDYAG